MSKKKRIARDIHDGPAQSVVNLCFKLEVCKNILCPKISINSPSNMARCKNISSTIKKVCSIIYDIEPSCLEDGLIKAIQNYLNMLN
jgi:two-component system sensor histidine kinase DegS